MEISHLITQLFIAEPIGTDWQYRLAGTGLCRWFGKELTGGSARRSQNSPSIYPIPPNNYCRRESEAPHTTYASLPTYKPVDFVMETVLGSLMIPSALSQARFRRHQIDRLGLEPAIRQSTVMDVHAILRNAWGQARPVVGELAQFVRYEMANGRCVARTRYEARMPDAPPGWRTVIGSEFVLDRISAQD